MGELCSKIHSACRWQRRKEDRPAEILTAALRLFADKGFALTKLNDVAKEAGVSKGTLYLYFDGKEALFKAVINEYVLPQIAKAEEQADKYSGSISELMFELQETWRINVLETELSGISKIMMAEASNFPELAQFYLENVIHRTRNFVAKLIRIGIERNEFISCNSEYAARTFLTPLVFSAVWKHSLAPFEKEYDIKEYLKSNLDIFLRGILKEHHG